MSTYIKSSIVHAITIISVLIQLSLGVAELVQMIAIDTHLILALVALSVQYVTTRLVLNQPVTKASRRRRRFYMITRY